MKSKIFLIMVLFGIVVSCQQKNNTKSPELLKQVLFDFYDGIKNKDFDKIKEVTTPDFTLYVDGEIWSHDSLISVLNSYPPYNADYSFDNFNIDMENSLGVMRYFSHGDFIFSDTLDSKFDWIESATFTKIDDKWKMNFLHSTTKK
ncbi:MAG: nuclear transport factor 2 family protein [Bacteroidota bacterium]